MSIQEHLNKIRNAIKGSEVRESIAKGIETAYDDASENGNANMEVKIARGTHPNLNARLNDVDTKVNDTNRQLAHKADDLIVRKKTQPITLNDFDGETLGIIQDGSGGTPINIESVPRDRSVSREKTTFFESSKNLFNKNNVISGYISNLDGNLYPSNDYSTTDYYIPTDGYTHVTLSPVIHSTWFYRIYFYDENGEKISGNNIDAGQDNTTISFPPNAKTFRVSVPNTYRERFQIEYGTKRTVYEPYQSHMTLLSDAIKEGGIDEKKLAVNSVSHEKATFIESKNVFNGTYVHYNFEGNPPYKVKSFHLPISIIVEIEGGEDWTFEKTDSSLFRIGLFTEYPTVGSVPESFYVRDNDNVFVVSTKRSHTYAMVTVARELAPHDIPQRIRVFKGDKPYKLSRDIDVEPTTTSNGFYISTDFSDSYNPITPIIPNIDNTNMSLSLIYDRVDDLVSEFPEYITKEVLGTEPSGIPINLYRFNAPETQGITETLPTVLYISGTHAGEYNAILSGLRFFTDLCKEWKNNNTLAGLRWNVNFIYIPVLNVYGMENRNSDTLNGRLNSNGVNLNRNFQEHFSFSEPGGYNSSGPFPLSEIEAQLVNQLLESEPNIIFAIDHHNFNFFDSTVPKHAIWTGSIKKSVNRHLQGWSRQMNSEFIREHSNVIDNKNGSFVRVNEHPSTPLNGYMSASFVAHGIPGTILESTFDNYLHDFNTKALGELIALAVKDLHSNKSKWM